MGRALFVILVVGACGRIGFDPDHHDSGGDGDGDVSVEEPFLVQSGASNPVAHSARGQVGLVFEQANSIGAVVLDDSGELVASMGPMSAAGSANRPRLSWSGESFTAIFDDGTSSQRTVYLAELGKQATAITSGRSVSPAIASHNDFSLAAWKREEPSGRGTIWTLAMQDGAASAPAKQIADSDDNSAPQVAASPDGFGLIWHQEEQNGDDKIQFRSLDRSGEPIGSVVLASKFAKSPTVAWDGAAFVVAWREKDPQSGDSSVVMARVSRGAEVVLSPTPISPAKHGGAVPAIAARGDEVGLAYRSDGSIWFARVARDGAPIAEPVRIEQGRNANLPSLVATDSGYLVTWQDAATGRADDDVYACAVR